jgi:hypothetical protein
VTTGNPPRDGDGAGPDHDDRRANPLQVAAKTTTDKVPDQLRRRREAARGADPWLSDLRAWRDGHDLLMARLGWAPEWQRQRALQLWEAGVR